MDKASRALVVFILSRGNVRMTPAGLIESLMQKTSYLMNGQKRLEEKLSVEEGVTKDTVPGSVRKTFVAGQAAGANPGRE